ncbi:calcineurin-like phosphoesterase C-terminal domain-containing protein [Euzebya tangerina]|uniref:calcineurin-like phosphoesterase C-terminal domain-containing protein n=1 Tax=Euzebya tangerina TaxID=591198 RepID=UPI0013C35E87|nr:calcineurin-like phosphoesterase C-terminal domain-containing protein [Euzebya tangerina]
MRFVPNRVTPTGRAVAASTALVLVATLALLAAPASADRDPTYVGEVEVIRTPLASDSPLAELAEAPDDTDTETILGAVFDDQNTNSRRDRREPGVPNVAVSNGRDVVLTDAQGRYELPAFDNMTLFVTKPAGYEVPVDEHNFPQFHYHHVPLGSPDLRFEGLPPSGPLPTAVNFPMVTSPVETAFNCAVIGDTQTYSHRELSYLRDGIVEDLAAREDLSACGALLLGDLMGDDLGLYPRFRQIMGQAGVPVRAVPGNHDLDFDADSDAHSTDTYRREIGPSYYSFDIGAVHFVGLDNVRYPCTPEDNPDGTRDFCDDPADHPDYNGVIGEEQMAWLAADLATVPPEKLVVIATHIPLVSFIDSEATKHQTDDVAELYALLEGRPALSISGHTHTLEHMSPGTSFAGWQDTVGVTAIPFPHVVAGAGSGAWWGGDLDADGIPMGFARNGTPGGYSTFSFDGPTYTSTFDATTLDDGQSMGIALNTPTFRDWATALREFDGDNNDVPPVNINDLGDPDVVPAADLDTSTMTANIYNATRDAEVTVSINDGPPQPMTLTQPGAGEGILEGLAYADPYAMVRQLQVARHAFVSTSGDPRAQGYERFQGAQFGPADPRPEDAGTDQSPHLWAYPMSGLPVGVHTAEVVAADPYAGEMRQTFTFEIVEELPPWGFREGILDDE